MILHPIIDLLKRIVVALPDYAGGGGLPDIITSIDGGEFTVLSDTASGSYTIYHDLGVSPTGVVIWAADIEREAYSVRCVDTYFAVLGNYVLNQVNTNGAMRPLAGAVTEGDIGSDSITMSNTQNYYKAGTTYKWLAWV